MDELSLVQEPEGLTLVGDGISMRGDFTKMIPRLRPNKLNGEMLVRAAKLKGLGEHPLAVDATAGMGEDSLLLAAAGYRVILFEYNSVIAALLEDTLKRSAKIPELADAVGRMHLICGDSIEGLKQLAETPDLVLLDPMFPARNKSGLIKKKFQLLQQLERPCGNEEELVHAAIEAHPRRIVIKRPLKGPYLADIKPAYSISGKAIRYDCLVF